MEDQIKCPRCKSTQIHSEKQGFSAGKAVAGAIVAGGVGLAAGAIGKNKIIITCLKCGHQFKPGEGDTSTCIKNMPSVEITYKEGECNIIICNSCGGRTTYGHSHCCECGKTFTFEDKGDLCQEPLSLSACNLCKQLTVKSGKFCSKCGKEKQNQRGGCAGVILLFIILAGSLIAIL